MCLYPLCACIYARELLLFILYLIIAGFNIKV